MVRRSSYKRVRGRKKLLEQTSLIVSRLREVESRTLDMPLSNLLYEAANTIERLQEKLEEDIKRGAYDETHDF